MSDECLAQASRFLLVRLSVRCETERIFCHSRPMGPEDGHNRALPERGRSRSTEQRGFVGRVRTSCRGGVV